MNVCLFVCVYVGIYVLYARPFGPSGGAAGVPANAQGANLRQLNEGRRSHMVGKSGRYIVGELSSIISIRV